MKTPPSISDLLARLARADAAWRREQARVLLWRALPYFAAALLCAVALDAFLSLRAPTRLGLLGVGGAAALGLAGLIAHRVWLRRNPPERVARHLEMRAPALGSRLINALQLVRQSQDPALPERTRALAAAAVERGVADTAASDLPALARSGADRRMLERSLLWLAGAVVLGLAFLPVTSVVLPRFFDPFGDHPPYAFTRLHIVQPLADNSPVTYGGKLAVRVDWAGHEPRELFLSAHPPEGPAKLVTVPMVRDGERGFIAELADVRSDLVLVAHAKDHDFYSEQRVVRVMLTPLIEQARVEIVPPAYTGLRVVERKLDFKSLGALHGSKLRFFLRSNRPLREGWLELGPLGVEGGAPTRVKLEKSGENEVACELPAEADARLRFRVTDIDGLLSEPTPDTLLTLSHDLPPVVEVREPAQDGFASVAFTLAAKFEASDDYGVSTLRIHRALNGVYTPPLVVEAEDLRRDLARGLAFDFVALGARPGDRVSFFAEAIDTAPTPQIGRSRTVTLTLISEDEYNQHLREIGDVASLTQKYGELTERFSALRDRQVALAEEAKALEEQLARDGATPELQARLAELAERQDVLDAELDGLADRLLEFVRPNPVYDFERDLAKRLTLESGALRESVAQSREARDASAARELGDTAGRGADLERRAREQAERLGARREQLAQDLEQPLRDLARLHELVKDINLFERAYLEQEALSEQMRAYAETAHPSREDQLAMKDLAARQAALREVLDQLPERMREHASAAEGEFPRAAGSARALADAIEEGRFASRARSATDRLLLADGREGAALTRRLAEDMGALMSACQGGEGESADELDQYLQARRPGGAGGSGGMSWEQMRQSRRFGPLGARSGIGVGTSPGGGSGPASGYSTAGGPPPPVMGAEPAPADPASGMAGGPSGKGGSGQGQGAGDGGAPAVQTGAPDVLRNLNPTDRESGATPSELGAEQYRELVDEYFRQLTRP